MAFLTRLNFSSLVSSEMMSCCPSNDEGDKIHPLEVDGIKSEFTITSSAHDCNNRENKYLSSRVITRVVSFKFRVRFPPT